MRTVLLLALVMALAACGDPATEDARGYTKAPLEEPGLLISGEPDAGLGTARIPLEPGLKGVEPAAFDRPAQAAGGGQDGGGGEDAPVALAPGVTRAQFDQGGALFAGQGGCQACHGQEGSGGMLGPDLTDDQWLHVEAPDVSGLADVIRSGVTDPVEYPGPMPAMGGASLTEEQIEALAGYVASLSGG
jgi:mono/diheme cytochrome c family protein